MEKPERKRPDDVLEDDAGGQYHRALLLVEASTACEYALTEFEDDEDFPADLREALRKVMHAEVLV